MSFPQKNPAKISNKFFWQNPTELWAEYLLIFNSQRQVHMSLLVSGVSVLHAFLSAIRHYNNTQGLMTPYVLLN